MLIGASIPEDLLREINRNIREDKIDRSSYCRRVLQSGTAAFWSRSSIVDAKPIPLTLRGEAIAAGGKLELIGKANA